MTTPVPTSQHDRAQQGAQRPATQHRYRAIFIAYTEGSSPAEIARRFRVSTSTVYMALDSVSQEAPSSHNVAYLYVLVESARTRIKRLNEDLEDARGAKRQAKQHQKIQFYNVIARLNSEIRKEEERLERLWGIIESGKLRIEVSRKGNYIDPEKRALIARIVQQLTPPPKDKPDPEYSFAVQMSKAGLSPKP